MIRRLVCRWRGHDLVYRWLGPAEGRQRPERSDCRRCGAVRVAWVFDPPITLNPGESMTVGFSVDMLDVSDRP